jgi:hypothetical protein
MFAKGWWGDSVGGSVVLRTLAPSSAIIVGPSEHSVYLDEHE